VIWLRRVWSFFRERFDQRDDPAVTRALTAADEVVWSCYSQPFKVLAGLGKPKPIDAVPLPFIDPVFAPEIFPIDLVPQGLRTDVDPDFLRRVLNQLPLAVVRLPPASVRAPWSLILLAHEVGHAIDQQFVGRAVRRAAIDALGLDLADADRWETWSAELFADLYALLVAGPWFVWMLASLEAGPDAELIGRRERYPSPAARLLTAQYACARLGVSLPDLIQGLPLDRLCGEERTLANDAEIGRLLVDTWLERPIRGVLLEQLTDFRAEDWSARGTVATWRQLLLGVDPWPNAGADRNTVRVVAAAGVAAWASIRERASAADRTMLGLRLCDALVAVREPGTRAGGGAPDTEASGQMLGRALLALSDEQLQA
jgi:hypothetical protein